LDRLVALDWPDFEVLVVDDSTDRTPEIVRTYSDRGVRLIRPGKPEGRCGARNLGILEASGTVVVILNADVLLPRDFLRRISAHYASGFDYVLVRSQVENMGDLFARYVECVGLYEFYGRDEGTLEWTEGFSCRRELALRAGLFPVGHAVPICAGEDAVFGANLRMAGARKKVDLGILVTHVAPARLREYWRVREGRGRGSPQIRRFIQSWSLPRIGVRAVLRLGRSIAWTALVFPAAYRCYKLARRSPNGLRDWLPFCLAWLIEQAAFHSGEWKGIVEIYSAEKAIHGARG
jgi:glycosyltransferase involved in cell wall biosynthesis